MRARLAPPLALVLAVALLAACSSNKTDDKAEPTLPPAPVETTTTTTNADPYAIPKVIDEAYVNKVLAALDQINGDIVREIVSTGAVRAESIERLRAVYNDPEYEVEREGLTRLLQSDLNTFRSPPGNRKTLVKKIVVARSDCIFVEAIVDFSEVVREPSAPEPGEFEAITLRRTQPDADPRTLNPTPWSVGHDEVIAPGAKTTGEPCTD